MPRQTRDQEAGVPFHVYARGVRRHDVFHDDTDRLIWLYLLAGQVEQQGWRCLTYCMMRNHFHLVLVPGTRGLSDGMRILSGRYAVHYNERYETSGHVWQGRYGNVRLRYDSQMVQTLTYVACNPVRAGICASPADYEWSAHAALSGRRENAIVDSTWLEMLSPDVGTARAAYRLMCGDAGPVAATPAPELLRRLPLPTLLGPKPSLAEVRAASAAGYALEAVAREMDCAVQSLQRRLSGSRSPA